MSNKPWEEKVTDATTDNEEMTRNSKDASIISTPILTILLSLFFLIIIGILFLYFILQMVEAMKKQPLRVSIVLPKRSKKPKMRQIVKLMNRQQKQKQVQVKRQVPLQTVMARQLQFKEVKGLQQLLRVRVFLLINSMS